MSGSSLPLILHNSAGEGWYHPGNRPICEDIAEQAYRDAIAYYRTELTDDEYKKIAVQQYENIDAFRRAVENAKDMYDGGNKTQKKALKWLEKLSDQINHYGAVLDVLVSSNPQYAALAWGAMKFVLSGVRNHAELVTQYARLLAEIGQMLPRVELHAILYPTTRMKEAISMVYASIIQALLETFKWYRKSGVGRFVAAIAHPFELRLKETVEQIDMHSRRFDKIASDASKAELRDMHRKIDHLMTITLNVQTITTRVDANFSFERNQVWKAQLSTMIGGMPQIELPLIQNPQTLLVRPGFYMDARALPIFLYRLRIWASEPEASLLAINSLFSMLEMTKWMTSAIVRHLKGAHKVVFAAITTVDAWNQPLKTPTMVLKYLVARVLASGAAVPDVSALGFKMEELRDNDAEDQWLRLLSCVLQQYPEVFLVVDVKPMFASGGGIEQRLQVVHIFKKLVTLGQASGQRIKVIIATYGLSEVDLNGINNGGNSFIIANLRRPDPLPPHRRTHFLLNNSRVLPTALRNALGIPKPRLKQTV